MDAPPDLVLLRTLLLTRHGADVADDLGLIFHDGLKAPIYDETPRNVLTFAGTGGDGVHFSLLVRGAVVGNSSPVVMTVPCARAPNRIVGRSLRHFLGIGLHSGYFVIEQLQYDFDDTVEHLRGRDWETGLSEPARAALADIACALGISAWSDYRQELLALEAEFAGLLETRA